MKKQSILIIGTSINSLYLALKCIDMGYKITILEKKNTSLICKTNNIYKNYNLFNDNHKYYINLLKRFSIKYFKINTNFNFNLLKIINNIIDKSKLIPNNILIKHTFWSLSNQFILTNDDIIELKKYESFFNIINAVDCINLFTNDININTNYYFLDDDKINELITKMINFILSKNVKIIYNTEVKNIIYQNNKFILHTNTDISYNTDILISTLSKKNLLNFSFWNNEQRYLLNSTSLINSAIIKDFIEDLIHYKMIFNNENELRTQLLYNLHIVFPINTNCSNYIYIWNNGYNNVLIRERIRNMYNNKFYIYSESYSKNNMFINYSFEYIDNTISNLYSIKFKS